MFYNEEGIKVYSNITWEVQGSSWKAEKLEWIIWDWTACFFLLTCVCQRLLYGEAGWSGYLWLVKLITVFLLFGSTEYVTTENASANHFSLSQIDCEYRSSEQLSSQEMGQWIVRSDNQSACEVMSILQSNSKFQWILIPFTTFVSRGSVITHSKSTRFLVHIDNSIIFHSKI